MVERPSRTAFTVDALGQRAKAAVKAAWWTATGSLARSLTQPTKGEQAKRFNPTAEPAGKGALPRPIWRRSRRTRATSRRACIPRSRTV